MFGRRGHPAYVAQYTAQQPYSNRNRYGPSMYNYYSDRQQPSGFHPNLSEPWGNSFSPQHVPFNQMPHNGYNPYPHTTANPYLGPYHNYGLQPYGQQKQHNHVQSIFQNPLEPEPDPKFTNSNQHYSVNPYMNPYPKQSFIAKQPSGVKSIMNSFKGQDGTLDINKMVDTAGTMMNAVSQVSSMVKGLGGIIKV
ncbi:YppG family protein [Cytobacillus massiliigabonensis]|uniref:YppG family protein n=1 Tax=Cytobacillus massiliigabonensis TaxID=1871011 RepID=UPI001F1B22D4|nr:YppG family protein [Cytobacillus massiliigabonensis]